jgi:hypothetical protein
VGSALHCSRCFTASTLPKEAASISGVLTELACTACPAWLSAPCCPAAHAAAGRRRG